MDNKATFITPRLFSFNGQEKTDEISGAGNHFAFDERGYDPRLGRWWSVDPLFAKYPAQSPYSFVGNSPILNREIDGRDYGVYIDHNAKTIIIKATYYTKKGNADSHTSAVQATEFWNEQSGKYQYTVGKGDAAITYDVQFNLTVSENDNPNRELNNDRMSSQLASTLGITKLTPDQSSNTYGVLPDDNKIFENGEEGKMTNGITKAGAIVNVKDSRKSAETGSHEVGHTLGLRHFLRGLLTATSNDPNRTNTISKGYVKDIIKNAFKRKDEKVGKGTTNETGTAPEGFSKGRVTEKK
jgi:RHS repeat-associated protein